MKKTNQPPAPSGFKKHYRLLLHICILAISGLAFTFYVVHVNKKIEKSRQLVTNQSADFQSAFTLIRKNDVGLTRPLMLADYETEALKFAPLKIQLTHTIDQWNKRGVVQTASVYLRELNQGNWMSINGNEQYLPGSLMKVAIMLNFLKQEEITPGLLNKELVCEKTVKSFPKQAYEGDSIITGKRYKISELLHYMIAESDNYATHVLSQHIDLKMFHTLFIDMEIPPDEINDVNYKINVREFSKLLRVLYNATYVNETLSEFGLHLLAGSKFMDGLAKKLPSDIVIAHKFGERGINNVSDFSESGIIYYKNDPYLLTIMTKGTDSREQAGLISELSNEVFLSMQQN